MIVRGPSSGTRRFFESSIAAKELTLEDFDVNIQSDSIATIKDLVMKNIGVSVLARSACRDDERRHRLVLLPIEGLPMVREINLIYLRDWSHPEILDGLVTAYKREANAAGK
jgi:DNA-binding transcriptional LysR family regulator